MNLVNHQKQKEIKFIKNFLILFIQQNQNRQIDHTLEKSVIDLFVSLSNSSFDALGDLFEFLIEKVPEKVKEGEFLVSNSLSKIFLKCLKK